MEKPSQSGLRNMTEGNVSQQLISFALPMFAGSVLQQLYSLVDSWVVGKFVGDGALAAVGAGYPVSFLIIALFIGISTGGTVVISQNFGAGRMDDVRDAIDSVYTLAIAGAVPMTILFVLLVNPILNLMQVNTSFYADAQTYLLITCAGLIGTVGYNANSCILQGLGDSRTPLLFLAISAVMNIVLDLVSVIVMGMGVAGVAYATIISQAFSWLFGIVYINRKYTEFSIRPLKFHYRRDILRTVLRIGLPAGLQYGAMSTAMLLCVSKINSFGEAYTASYNVGNKIDNCCWLAIQALANALTSFVGQNIGAGRVDRVKKGVRTALLLAMAFCAVCMAVIIPLRHTLVGFFTDTEETILAGGYYLWFIMWGYPPLAVMTCLNNTMRGAGDSVFPMIANMLSMIVIRLPVIYYIADRYGPSLMYLSYDICWVFGCVVMYAYYLTGRWKKFAIASTAAKTKEVSQ